MLPHWRLHIGHDTLLLQPLSDLTASRVQPLQNKNGLMRHLQHVFYSFKGNIPKTATIRV